MSLLLDAFKKAEETKKTKPDAITPQSDSTSNVSAVNDEQEELLLFEITDSDKPKTVAQTAKDSSLKDWDNELLQEFQPGNSQLKTASHDSEPASDFSATHWNSEEPFSPFQNNESQIDSTATNWNDELLTQYDEEQATSIRSSSEEAVVQKGSEPLETEPSTINRNEEQWFDKNQNEAIELAQSTANNSNRPFDSSSLESVASPQPKPELDFDEKQPPELKTDVTVQKTNEEHQRFNRVTKESPRPENAQRVLAASARPTSSKRTFWLLGILGISLVGMGTVYYYYSQSSLINSSFITNSSLDFLKRRQAMRDAPTLSTDSNQTQTAALQSSPASSQPLPTPSKAANETANEQSQSVATKDAKDKPLVEGFLSVAQLGMAKSVELVTSTKTPTEPPIQSKSESKAHSDDKSVQPSQQKPTPTASSRQQPTAPKQQKVVPKAKTFIAESSLPPKEQGIHTLQKNSTPQMNTELYKGYAAFQRGDNQAAQRAYANALEQDKNNRDALLGLAALAWQSGNVHIAQQHYQRVLQLYPQDTHAQVGLINTLGNRSPKSESQLKLLLEQTPESAYIHFSLGNFYASLGRWAQAQQAYFEALRYDNSQADYAYNLAVSLDHLNQPRIALSYYQKAIQLVQNQPINFNRQAVQKRIQTLRSHTHASALANLPTER